MTLDPVLGRYELYRIITDYDALREGFADRIEDLNTPFSEIDRVADLTGGHVQKLLVKSNADWSRSFTWKTLPAMLKGTGLALVLVVDDERFLPIKQQLAKRRRRNKPAIAGSVQPTWLFKKKKAREMGKRRFSLMSDLQRARHQRKAGKASGIARRHKARKSPPKPEARANE